MEQTDSQTDRQRVEICTKRFRQIWESLEWDEKSSHAKQLTDEPQRLWMCLCVRVNVFLC